MRLAMAWIEVSGDSRVHFPKGRCARLRGEGLHFPEVNYDFGDSAAAEVSDLDLQAPLTPPTAFVEDPLLGENASSAVPPHAAEEAWRPLSFLPGSSPETVSSPPDLLQGMVEEFLVEEAGAEVGVAVRSRLSTHLCARVVRVTVAFQSGAPALSSL